jgi:hypothetical protein
LIVDTFKSSRHKREIAAALRVELEDLQYRLAAASYLLISHYGKLDKTFLTWLRPILERQDPNGATLALIQQWIALDGTAFSQITQQLRYIFSRRRPSLEDESIVVERMIRGQLNGEVRFDLARGRARVRNRPVGVMEHHLAARGRPPNGALRLGAASATAD